MGMKAIALLSGGLDSTLAAKLIDSFGIELIAFNTRSPFCLCVKKGSDGCIHGAASAAKQLGLRLISTDMGDEYLRMVAEPKHGYGSNLNPCLDCRILLFKKAREVMEREQAGFIITGEVIGQRPMSQRLEAMKLIDREAGVEGLVLRPLCAQHLEETVPEKSGWVEREKLLSLSGRGRKGQFELAKEFNIHDFPCPGGGCLLTDPNFTPKVKDLITHGLLTIDNVRLLKVGRHFRLSPTARLIVGRDEQENLRLQEMADSSDFLLTSDDLPGPVAVFKGDFDQAQLEIASGIVLRYCDLDKNLLGQIAVRKGGEEFRISTAAMPVEQVESIRI